VKDFQEIEKGTKREKPSKERKVTQGSLVIRRRRAKTERSEKKRKGSAFSRGYQVKNLEVRIGRPRGESADQRRKNSWGEIAGGRGHNGGSDKGYLSGGEKSKWGGIGRRRGLEKGTKRAMSGVKGTEISMGEKEGRVFPERNTDGGVRNPSLLIKIEASKYL